MAEVKVGDRVRLGGSHSRDTREIPTELLKALQSADSPEARAEARADIEAVVARPAHRYGRVIGFEPSPRVGDPPRVQIVTDEDALAPLEMVPVKMADGVQRPQPRATAFTTVDAADVEVVN